MPTLSRDAAFNGLQGLFSITVTPFLKDGTLDRAALAALIERTIDAQYDGLLIGGTYGEFATMDLDERAALFRYVTEVVSGRIPLLLCSAGADPRGVTQLTAFAAELGGIPMATAPFISEVTDTQILSFFQKLAATVPALVIYNAPGMGITLSPELIERISEIPQIVGLKQGALSPLAVDELLGRVGGRIRLFCASDLQMPGAIAAGFDGLSSTNSCALPELIRDSFRAFQRGDAGLGGALYRSWYRYRRFARMAGQPQTVKAAMDLRGWTGGHVRAPLRDLDAAERSGLTTIISALCSTSQARCSGAPPQPVPAE